MSCIFYKQGKSILFIHIPKTAGKSIRKSFLDQEYNFKNITNIRTKNNNYHSTYYDACKMFSKSWNVSFSVVRNPWARAFSWFCFRRKIIRLDLKKIASNANKETKIKKGYKSLQQEYYDMNNFNKWLKTHFHTTWDNHTWFGLHIPQVAWLHSDISDHIIFKFESLSNEFNSFFKMELPITNRSVSSMTDYRYFYNTKSKKLIEKTYEEDIDVFAYKF